MKNKILFGIIITSLILIAGCADVNISDISKNLTKEDINKIIACESPYIRHEAGCCLDQNNNKICDEDEGIKSPVQPSCTDSDGGKNYYVKGSISGNMKFDLAREDFCLSENRVREVYCENNDGAIEAYYCPIGYICLDGACIQSNSKSCTDSDGGSNFVKGTISGIDSDSNSYEMTDYCAADNPKNLKEFSCNPNKEHGWDSTVIYCENGCESGACIKKQIVTTGCGDSICDMDENCMNCEEDCGCTSSVSYCDTALKQCRPIQIITDVSEAISKCNSYCLQYQNTNLYTFRDNFCNGKTFDIDTDGDGVIDLENQSCQDLNVRCEAIISEMEGCSA